MRGTKRPKLPPADVTLHVGSLGHLPCLPHLQEFQADQPQPPLLKICTTGPSYLVRRQVYDRVAAPFCSATYFHSKCRAYRGISKKANVVLGRALVQQCVRKGALLPRGGAHVIITEGQAKAALVSCSVPPAVVTAFKQTLDSPVMPLLNPEACFAASSLEGGSVHPAALNFGASSNLPSQLLPNPPDLSKGQRGTSLTHVPAAMQSPALNLQLEQFGRYYDIPVELRREGGALLPISQATIVSSILLFLGYVHFCFKVKLPNLQHCVRADLIIAYVSSRLKAGLSRRSLTKDCDAFLKVVPFWAAMAADGGQLLTQQLADLKAWLIRLRKQLRLAVARTKPDCFTLISSGRWASARDLVQHFERARLSIVGEVEEFLASHRHLSYLLASALQDVLLVNFLFGYLPPTRLQGIITMTLPSSEPTCKHPHCRLGPECKGNRLERQDDDISLVLPHHKNAARWGHAIVIQSLPQPLAQLCVLYLDHAIPTLHRKLPNAVEHGRVFFRPKGGPFDHTFSTYFQQVLHKIGMPQQVHIPPQNLRHIFVQERRAAAAVEGPEDVGASMLMGNCAQTWTMHYQTSRWDGQQAQEATQAMTGWRQAMLQSTDAPAVIEDAGLPVPDNSDSDASESDEEAYADAQSELDVPEVGLSLSEQADMSALSEQGLEVCDSEEEDLIVDLDM